MPTTTGIATEFITFTRASNATVTDSDGKVKWAPANLLTNSESFDAASWTKSSVTPTANSIAAPNGTTTADTLAASGANGTTLQTFTAEAISYTFAVWLKRKTGTGNIQIAADSGTYTTVTITSDWALYTVTQTPAAGSKSAGIRIVTSADEVYAWGASLYRSDLAMQPNTSAYPMYNPTTPKNLLGYTEDFSNAAWAVATGTATKTSNTDIAPNGLQTADTLAATSADTIVWQTYNPVVNCQYTASIWLRRKTGSGAVQFTADGGTFTTITLTTTWQRFSATYTAPAGLKAVGVKIVTSGDEVYAWGAQLSDSASLDPYVPVYGAAVTSAAYYGPRRDFDPVTLACKGLLVEEQRANSFLYSAAFDNAAWQKGGLNAFGSGSVANTTATASPTGAFNASFIQENTSTGTHEIRQVSITVTSGISYTSSIYVKAAGRTRVQFQYFDGTANAYPSFNISTGTLIAANGADATSIVPVGNGWYRISVTKTSASTSASIYLYMDSGSGTSYTGDGTSGLYIWGAQLEAGSFATSYIPTGAATATRNADVASVSTQAFPYSATEGTIVVNVVPTLTIQTNTRALWFSSASDRVVDMYINVGDWQVYNGSAVITPGTPAASVGVQSKFATAYKSGSYASVLNGGAAGTAASTLVNTATNMYLGCSSSGGFQLNGHIRQITYLPRRISNADLVTRST